MKVRRSDSGACPAKARRLEKPASGTDKAGLESGVRPELEAAIDSPWHNDGPDRATGRTGVAEARDAEVIMVTNARSERIAAIEKRIQEGLYNTRGSIERVVDRLLTSWNLGSTRSSKGPGA